jgi:hypothetical protein
MPIISLKVYQKSKTRMDLSKSIYPIAQDSSITVQSSSQEKLRNCMIRLVKPSPRCSKVINWLSWILLRLSISLQNFMIHLINLVINFQLLK